MLICISCKFATGPMKRQLPQLRAQSMSRVTYERTAAKTASQDLFRNLRRLARTSSNMQSSLERLHFSMLTSAPDAFYNVAQDLLGV